MSLAQLLARFWVAWRAVVNYAGRCVEQTAETPTDADADWESIVAVDYPVRVAVCESCGELAETKRVKALGGDVYDLCRSCRTEIPVFPVDAANPPTIS